MHWDASYKEAGHLCQHHGQRIFMALITATNQLSDVRMQFHVVPDGHDQMLRSLEAYRATVRTYGHSWPICASRTCLRPTPRVVHGAALPAAAAAAASV